MATKQVPIDHAVCVFHHMTLNFFVFSAFCK